MPDIMQNSAAPMSSTSSSYKLEKPNVKGAKAIFDAGAQTATGIQTALQLLSNAIIGSSIDMNDVNGAVALLRKAFDKSVNSTDAFADLLNFFSGLPSRMSQSAQVYIKKGKKKKQAKLLGKHAQQELQQTSKEKLTGLKELISQVYGKQLSQLSEDGEEAFGKRLDDLSRKLSDLIKKTSGKADDQEDPDEQSSRRRFRDLNDKIINFNEAVEKAPQKGGPMEQALSLIEPLNDLIDAVEAEDAKLVGERELEKRRLQKTDEQGSITRVDWENELKNAKYLDQKVRVWQRYYREEWGEDANIVFKINGAFMEECMAYGFDKRTNPFIAYLRRVLSNPGINKSKVPTVYPAVHNAFVRRYLLIGDIRGGDGDTGGIVPYASCNIINSSGLYDLSPSEAFEELRLQQIAVEKFKQAVNNATDTIGVNLRRAYKYDQNQSNAISMFVAAVFGDGLNPSKPTFSGIMGKRLAKLRSPRGVRNILAIYFNEIPDAQLNRSKTQLTAENLSKLIEAILKQEPSAAKLSVALTIAGRLHALINDDRLGRKISQLIPDYNNKNKQPSAIRDAVRKAMEGYRFDSYYDSSKAIEALAEIAEQELKKGQGEA